MADTKITFEPPPNIDPTKATLAYGYGALPRLNRELKNSELLTKQRAVKALIDFLHDHEHIANALREGIIPSLRNLLADPDLPCRAMAVECFYVICHHATGREAFIHYDIITPLSQLFEDNEDIVRKKAHATVEILSETTDGADGIVQAKLIPKLIEKVQVEPDEIKESILSTLRNCLRLETENALEVKGMHVFTQLLSHSSSTIRSMAAECVLRLATSLRGKDDAIVAETVPALTTLLSDRMTPVRAAASGALAFICVTVHGRYTAINGGAIPPLLPLVDDPSSEVRVNALKTITCLAEAPEGRRILLDHVDKIRLHEFDDNSGVAKHAQIAVKVITWKP